MKSSVITSVALATLSFMTSAEANVIPTGEPGLPSTYVDCLKIAGCTNPNTYGDCLARANVHTHWKTLCTALNTCEDNHSGDEAHWRECIEEAQGTYEKSMAKEGPAKAEPYVGEDLPVSTDASGSHCEQRDPNHKGFMNAQE